VLFLALTAAVTAAVTASLHKPKFGGVPVWLLGSKVLTFQIATMIQKRYFKDAVSNNKTADLDLCSMPTLKQLHDEPLWMNFFVTEGQEDYKALHRPQQHDGKAVSRDNQKVARFFTLAGTQYDFQPPLTVAETGPLFEIYFRRVVSSKGLDVDAAFAAHRQYREDLYTKNAPVSMLVDGYGKLILFDPTTEKRLRASR
jgi:hypothetical protein